MILDFHTHVGDIFPIYKNIPINKPAPPPHYLMISSSAIEASDHLFYRKRPHPFSFGFLKHALITLLRKRQTFRGMVISNLLYDMRKNDVNRSVVLPIEYNDGIERSAQLIQACHKQPDLIPFCSVHPHERSSIQKMHTYMQMGAKGLKLHPNFQRIFPNDEAMLPLYAEYSQYHLPLIFHSGLTGREGRLHNKGIFSSLEFMNPLPQKFPIMPIVLAHAGISQYQKAITLAQQHANIHLEISGQPAQHIRQALAVLGSKRLLFGTDWPFWNQRLALQAVRQAVDNDLFAEQDILYKNAEKLLYPEHK